MPITPIDLGAGPSPANSASSDTIYSAFLKTNANIADLNNRLSSLEHAIQYDHPGNTVQGVQPAPVLLRGTVSAHRWDGVTPGANLSTDMRLANRMGLQAAIDYAVAGRKFFELEPGLFELQGRAGLHIPPNKDGFSWRGSKGSVLKQFSNNCPVLTIGDVTNPSRDCQDLHFSGVRLCYSMDQSLNPASSALRIGLLRNSTIEQVSVLADYGETGPLVNAYRGIHVTNSAAQFGFFSNTLRDIVVGGAAYSLLDISLVGTGSVFSNIYLTQGVTGHPRAIAGPPLRIIGAADMYESVFEQLNIEWCITNTVIALQSCRGMTFFSTHLEGNELTGRAPSVAAIATSQIELIGFNVLDLGIHGSAITRGSRPALLRCYGDTAIAGSTVQVSWSAPGKVDTGFDVVVASEFSPPDAHQAVTITNFVVRDLGDGARFLSLDRNMPVSDFPAPSVVDRYSFGEMRSSTSGARIDAKASMTVYGQHDCPLIAYPAALSAPRALKLANRLKATGAGSTIPPAIGALVGVRRDHGVGDGFDLAVLGHDETTLATITSAGQTRWFRFDGVHWLLVA